MEEYTLDSDNNPDVVFTGELMASTNSKTTDSTRWMELKVYLTEGGTYIVQRTGITLWDSESDIHQVTICRSEESLRAELGYTDLAKEIYAQMDIDATVRID